MTDSMLTRGRTTLRSITPLVVALVAACDPGTNMPTDEPAPRDASWAVYGGDAGGSRYSPLDLINRENVRELEVAWTAQTGDWSHTEGGTEMSGPCSSSHRPRAPRPAWDRQRYAVPVTEGPRAAGLAVPVR